MPTNMYDQLRVSAGYQKALDYYGGNRSALARALNITPASLHFWREVIPLERAKELHQITQGELHVLDLRPDFFEGLITREGEC